jgi:hypothetical protein
VEPPECEGSETGIKHQAAFIGSHVALPIRGILQKGANPRMGTGMVRNSRRMRACGLKPTRPHMVRC